MREVGVTTKQLVRTALVMINLLRMQKHLEDAWVSENKEPVYMAMTLDTFSVKKAFERVKTILTCVCGATGVPLVYVLRHQLIPENKDDDPPFGEEDTKYNSIDQEMTTSAPILTNDVNYNQEYKAL